MSIPATLRPLRVGEILDVGIKIYLKHARTLFKIVIVVVAPIQVLSLLVSLSTVPEAFTAPTTYQPFNTGEIWLFGAGAVIIGILSFLTVLLATGACFKTISDVYLGHAPDARGSLRFARQNLRSLLWANILALLFMTLGLVALVIPGIYLWIALSLVSPVVLLEGLKGRQSLKRSRFLVREMWGKTFATIFVSFLLAMVVSTVVSALINALVFVGDQNSLVLQVTLNTISSTVAQVISTPFQAAILAVLFFDLKVRKEGFDLQLLAERMGGGGAAMPPPDLFPPPPPIDFGEKPPYWPPPPGWTPGPPAPPPE